VGLIGNLIFLGLLFFSSQAFAVPSDKVAHFAVSIVLTQNIYIALKKKHKPVPSLLIAVVSTLALGALKEYALDSSPDHNDMVANTLGVMTGSVLLYSW
jgi:VanZ family protein